MGKYYHYTSISTLYNMLDKSIIKDESTGTLYLQFHASHISTLNDTSERNLYILPFMAEVRKYASKRGRELTSIQEEKLRKMCFCDAYVISLSTCQDDLVMWRGYGENGHGVCLEFDFSKAISNYMDTKSNTFIMEDAKNIDKCNYIYPQDIVFDSDLIQKTYHCLIDATDESNENIIRKASVIRQITKEAMLCKHKAYEGEHESRFILFGGTPHFYDAKEGTIRKSYVIKTIPLDDITSVTIGPCIRDSRDIICFEQYLRMKLIKNTKIVYSTIPYRG